MIIEEGRKWQEVKSRLEELDSLYHQWKEKNVTMKTNKSRRWRQEITKNLSVILNLSLVFNSPYEIIKRILMIDPEISSMLVLIPYSPDHIVTTATRRSLNNGGSFLRRSGSCRAASPNPPDTSDIASMIPIQIACKKGRPDVIRRLLLNDKAKMTYRHKDSNERNLLHYATVCAICRYRNQQNEPVLLDFEATATSTHIIDGNIQGSQSTETAEHVLKKHQEQGQEDEETSINQLLEERDTSTRIEKKSVCTPIIKIPSLPSCTSFQEYVNLIKLLCKHSPILLKLRDNDNYSALEIARILRSKIKEKMKHTLFLDKDDKTYCKRVDYVYKILKHAYQRYKCLVASIEADDLQSEYAQCGESTGWTLNELLEEYTLTSSQEKNTFVYLPRKTEII